jgi:hypothetical protein
MPPITRPQRLYPNSPDSFLGQLVAELDRLGIGSGGQFVIQPVIPGGVRTLDGPGQARTTDRRTAKKAALTLGKPGQLRHTVLAAMCDAGEHGLTNDEMYEAVDPGRNRGRDSWVPRIGELIQLGYVAPLDGITRPGRSNHSQQVFAATSAGYAALELPMPPHASVGQTAMAV